ncbi:MAG TPA: hypothetical protein PLK94_12320, partial [Alphaproteobacteria bacterium]|nr:hypothetical protein [Alphaproteobacteria bacterium]
MSHNENRDHPKVRSKSAGQFLCDGRQYMALYEEFCNAIDLSIAVLSFAQAAIRGSTEAMAEVGINYSSYAGVFDLMEFDQIEGFNPDWSVDQKSLFLIQKSAEGECSRGMYLMGRVYEHGMFGVSVDHVVARRMYVRAHDAGCESATTAYADLDHRMNELKMLNDPESQKLFVSIAREVSCRLFAEGDDVGVDRPNVYDLPIVLRDAADSVLMRVFVKAHGEEHSRDRVAAPLPRLDESPRLTSLLVDE